ncbi:MAG: hypothetical protein Q7S92_00590 [Candidatus Diapherotrites archaeon]|nr:hypothetical protein [Candidatus Diapherotrites archaeon]
MKPRIKVLPVRINVLHVNPVAARKAFARKHPIQAYIGKRAKAKLRKKQEKLAKFSGVTQAQSGVEDTFRIRKRKSKLRVAGVLVAGAVAGSTAFTGLIASSVPQQVRVLKTEFGTKGQMTIRKRSMVERFKVPAKHSPVDAGLAVGVGGVIGSVVAGIGSVALAERRRRNRRR